MPMNPNNIGFNPYMAYPSYQYGAAPQMQQRYQPPETSYPQMQQQNFINGKIVDSVDVVRATDIPMDGNMYYFPKADGTQVFAKQWLPNGTTRIMTYNPTPENEQQKNQNSMNIVDFSGFEEIANNIIDRLDSIEKRFDGLEQTIKPAARTGARVKKEADSE